MYSLSFFGLVAMLLAICGKLADSQEEPREVVISLFATDLNKCDDLSPCDAVVKIMCSSVSSDWKLCGETREIKDDNYPVWPERFIFQYRKSELMRWRFDVIDKDLIIDDPIGSVSTSVEAFLNATEVQKTLRFDLAGRGYFYVHHRTM